jgi:hypothetical protein
MDDVAKGMKKWSQICLTFNKIAPAKDTLCKLDKQRFLSSSMLGVKQNERPVKNTDVRLICRNQVFTLPEDPQRNHLHSSRFQKPPTYSTECKIFAAQTYAF